MRNGRLICSVLFLLIIFTQLGAVTVCAEEFTGNGTGDPIAFGSSGGSAFKSVHEPGGAIDTGTWMEEENSGKKNVSPDPEAYPDFYYNNSDLSDDGKMTSSVQYTGAWEKQSVASAENRPNTGKAEKVLVLRIQFSDEQFDAEHNDAYFTGIMERMKDYYEKNSGYVANSSGMTIDYTLAPVVTTTAAMSYYGKDKSIAGDDNYNGYIYELAREAVKLTKASTAASINFSEFDADSDGIIDHIFLIHAGYGQESTPGDSDNIWSHRWEIGGGELIENGDPAESVYAYNYTCVPETGTLGVFAHEFGHDIGLKDLYDTDGGANGYTEGVGDWDVMGSGSWNHKTGEPSGSSPANLSAWSRSYLGWAVPERVSTNRTITFYNSDGYSSIYQIGNNTITGEEEYYLAEYRRKTGDYDIALPGEGLLIWHVDEKWMDTVIEGGTVFNRNKVNSYAARLGVSLEQADGSYEIDNGDNRGDSGDPFPGASLNYHFMAVPYEMNNSNITAGKFLYIDVLNISADGDTASAEVYAVPAAPASAPVIITPENMYSVISRPVFQWQPLPQTQQYNLEISESEDFSYNPTTYILKSLTGDFTYDGNKFAFTLPASYVLEDGMTYYWRLAGTNDLTVSGEEVWSDVRSMTVPHSPEAPVVTFSFDGTEAGKLMGITPEMEYSLDRGANYTRATVADLALSSEEIAGISAVNDIRVRIAETESVSAGAIRLINILPGPVINVTADDNENKVNGIDETMEFSTDQIHWTRYTGSSMANNLPDLSSNCTLYVRAFATGVKLAGPTRTLHFTVPAPIDPLGSGGGGGGGGGGVPAPAPAPAVPVATPLPVASTADDIPAFGLEELAKQINNEAINNVVADISLTTAQAITVSIPVMTALLEKGKSITMNSRMVDITLPDGAVSKSILTAAGPAAQLKIGFEPVEAGKMAAKAGDALVDDGKGLFIIGDRLYEFNLQLISNTGTTVITSFDVPVTITISLKGLLLDSVDVDKLGVYYYNELTKTWEYMGGRYDSASGSITFSTSHFSLYAVMENELTFDDIQTHWAKKDIEKMAARYITTGVGGGKFNPQGTVTRAEFITWLIRALEIRNTEMYRNTNLHSSGVNSSKAANSLEELPYQDVLSGKWYADSILIAYRNGLIDPDISFRPDVNITREEMAYMIAAGLKYKNKAANLSEQQIKQQLDAFADQDKIQELMKPAVAGAVRLGIINGRPGKLFAPQDHATRAEGLVMIRRLLSKI